MSSSDANPPPPPSPPLLRLPFPAGYVAGNWGQYHKNPGHSDSHSQHEIAPTFKRLRNSENSLPNSRPLSPMNPMMDPPPNLPGGKGTSHIFYKTRLCARFLKGTCGNSGLCRYAHGLEDLREPAHNWQEHVRGLENLDDEERFIRSMKICKWYYKGGTCPFGETCTFLHERLKKFRTDKASQGKSSSIIVDTAGPNKQPDNKHVNANSEAFLVKPVFWKAKICISWEKTGHCPFGETCHFVHGKSELKMPCVHVEPDPMAQFSAIQREPPSLPETESAPALNEEEKEEKKTTKWKLNKKISGIYADWIDGFTAPDEFPSNEEA